MVSCPILAAFTTILANAVTTHAEFLVRTATTGQFCGETLITRENNTYPAYITCQNGLLCETNNTCTLYKRNIFERCENSIQCDEGLKCQVHFDGTLRCGGSYNIHKFKPYGLYSINPNVQLPTQDCSQYCHKQFFAFVGNTCVCAASIGDVALNKLFDFDYEHALDNDACVDYTPLDSITNTIENGDMPPNQCRFWTDTGSNQIFLYRMMTMEDPSSGSGNSNFGMSENDPFYFVGYYEKPSLIATSEYCVKRLYSDACKCDQICKNNVYMAIGDVSSYGPNTVQTCLCGDQISEVAVTTHFLPDYNRTNCALTEYLDVITSYNIGNPTRDAVFCQGKYAWGVDGDNVVAVYRKLSVNGQTNTEHKTRATGRILLGISGGILAFIFLLFTWSQISDVDYETNV